jgi:hypothetical protein
MTPLSSCIRRLLASFIVCKSCISAVTMASFSSNASGSGKNDVSTYIYYIYIYYIYIYYIYILYIYHIYMYILYMNI